MTPSPSLKPTVTAEGAEASAGTHAGPDAAGPTAGVPGRGKRFPRGGGKSRPAVGGAVLRQVNSGLVVDEGKQGFTSLAQVGGRSKGHLVRVMLQCVEDASRHLLG